MNTPINSMKREQDFLYLLSAQNDRQDKSFGSRYTGSIEGCLFDKRGAFSIGLFRLVSGLKGKSFVTGGAAVYACTPPPHSFALAAARHRFTSLRYSLIALDSDPTVLSYLESVTRRSRRRHDWLVRAVMLL